MRAGLRPLDALEAATVDAARVLGMADTLGSVAVGKRADLLLLDADPLEDLAALRNPVGVMSGGRYYDRAAIAELLSGAQAPPD